MHCKLRQRYGQNEEPAGNGTIADPYDLPFHKMGVQNSFAYDSPRMALKLGLHRSVNLFLSKLCHKVTHPLLI